MNSLHFEHGYKAAQAGAWRVMPKGLSIFTTGKQWYAGFDVATKSGEHMNLNNKGSLRKGVKISGVKNTFNK